MFIADLRLDPSKLRQSGDPVRTDTFTLFNQIGMQLAMAVNLAAVGPGLVQQLGLAPVFLVLAHSSEPVARHKTRPAGCAGADTSHGWKAAPDARPRTQIVGCIVGEIRGGLFRMSRASENRASPLQAPDLAVPPAAVFANVRSQAQNDRLPAKPFRHYADRKAPLGDLRRRHACTR